MFESFETTSTTLKFFSFRKIQIFERGQEAPKVKQKKRTSNAQPPPPPGLTQQATQATQQAPNEVFMAQMMQNVSSHNVVLSRIHHNWFPDDADATGDSTPEPPTKWLKSLQNRIAILCLKSREDQIKDEIKTLLKINELLISILSAFCR